MQSVLVDTCEIRPAVLADMPSLKAVYRRSSLSNVGDRADLLANPDVLELSDVSVREGRMLIAVAGNEHAGFATILDTGRSVELDGLFVHPERMRQGVGRQLVLAVMAMARPREVGRVEVTANTHALAFYESVGFVSDGVVETRFDTAVRMHADVDPGNLDSSTKR